MNPFSRAKIRKKIFIFPGQGKPLSREARKRLFSPLPQTPRAFQKSNFPISGKSNFEFVPREFSPENSWNPPFIPLLSKKWEVSPISLKSIDFEDRGERLKLRRYPRSTLIFDLYTKVCRVSGFPPRSLILPLIWVRIWLAPLKRRFLPSKSSLFEAIFGPFFRNLQSLPKSKTEFHQMMGLGRSLASTGLESEKDFSPFCEQGQLEARAGQDPSFGGIQSWILAGFVNSWKRDQKWPQKVMILRAKISFLMGLARSWRICAYRNWDFAETWTVSKATIFKSPKILQITDQ